jgi:hypothetical protein
MAGGCAHAAAAGGRCETTCAERVEKISARVFFRGEIESPQNVDHCEDEPAGCNSIERSNVCEYGFINTNDGKDNGNGAKCYDSETEEGADSRSEKGPS